MSGQHIGIPTDMKFITLAPEFKMAATKTGGCYSSCRMPFRNDITTVKSAFYECISNWRTTRYGINYPVLKFKMVATKPEIETIQFEIIMIVMLGTCYTEKHGFKPIWDMLQ